MTAISAKSTSPRFYEGYVLLSQLLYSPDLLETKKPELRPPFTFLTEGDPQAIRQKGQDAEDELDKCDPDFGAKFIPNLGRIVEDTTLKWVVDRQEAAISGKAHIPYFIYPSFEIVLVGPEYLVENLQADCSLWLHLFPDGIIYILIGVHWQAANGLGTSHLVDFLQHLSPTDPNKQVRYRSTHGGGNTYGDAPDLARMWANNLWRELLREGAERSELQPAGSGRIIYLYDVRPQLDRKKHTCEMAGIATLNPRWELFDDETAKTKATKNFGQHRGDWNILGRWQIVLYTPLLQARGSDKRGSKRRRARRTFMWKVASADNLARSHAFLYSHFADKLVKATHQILRAEHEGREWLENFFTLDFVDTGLVGYLRDLLSFRHNTRNNEDLYVLPSYQRKVYAKTATDLSIRQERQRLARNLVDFLERAREWESGLFTTVVGLSDLLGKAIKCL